MPNHSKGTQFSSDDLFYQLGAVLDHLYYFVAALLNEIQTARKIKGGNDAIIDMCSDLNSNN